MDTKLIPELQAVFSGPVVTAADTDYASLKDIFNRVGAPACILRPQTTEQVVTAIRFVREHKLPFSVRSGGHGMAGFATNDGGVVIDLSLINTVEVTDPTHHIVRIGSGARWGDVAQALAASGLVISAGDTTSVGVGGLTLGGGIGWMVRKFGLAIDQLKSVDIVTADGVQLQADEAEHADLFWAIRGGGGNFGIVTHFTFKANPLKAVVSATIMYEIDGIETVTRGWADAMREAPRELTSMLNILPPFGPEAPAKIMFRGCYAGDNQTAAEQAFAPFLKLGTVQSHSIEAHPYLNMVEAMPPSPGPMSRYARDGFIKNFKPECAKLFATGYGKPGSPILQLRSMGGVMAAISPDAMAFPHRDAEMMAVIVTIAFGPVAPESAQASLQSAWNALQPFTEGVYLNFTTDGSVDALTAAFPLETLKRLGQVKAAYDPENLFRQNHNILPRQ